MKVGDVIGYNVGKPNEIHWEILRIDGKKVGLLCVLSNHSSIWSIGETTITERIRKDYTLIHSKSDNFKLIYDILNGV